MKSPKDVAREYLATFSTGDVDSILGSMTDDATWWVSGQVEGMSGTYEREPFGALLREAFKLYVGGALRIIPTSIIAEGRHVAVEADGFVEMVSGREYRPRYHFLFEVTGEKVSKVREYMDTMHAWEIFFKPD